MPAIFKFQIDDFKAKEFDPSKQMKIQFRCKECGIIENFGQVVKKPEALGWNHYFLLTVDWETCDDWFWCECGEIPFEWRLIHGKETPTFKDIFEALLKVYNESSDCEEHFK